MVRMARMMIVMSWMMRRWVGNGSHQKISTSTCPMETLWRRGKLSWMGMGMVKEMTRMELRRRKTREERRSCRLRLWKAHLSM